MMFFVTNYLFITYIVTSKPKLISAAAVVVHMIIPFRVWRSTMSRFIFPNYERDLKFNPMRYTQLGLVNLRRLLKGKIRKKH